MYRVIIIVTCIMRATVGFSSEVIISVYEKGQDGIVTFRDPDEISLQLSVGPEWVPITPVKEDNRAVVSMGTIKDVCRNDLYSTSTVIIRVSSTINENKYLISLDKEIIDSDINGRNARYVANIVFDSKPTLHYTISGMLEDDIYTSQSGLCAMYVEPRYQGPALHSYINNIESKSFKISACHQGGEIYVGQFNEYGVFVAKYHKKNIKRRVNITKSDVLYEGDVPIREMDIKIDSKLYNNVENEQYSRAALIYRKDNPDVIYAFVILPNRAAYMSNLKNMQAGEVSHLVSVPKGYYIIKVFGDSRQLLNTYTLNTEEDPVINMQ